MPDYVIDKEFANLLPPLSDDEYLRLTTSMMCDGQREPGIVWAETNILIDGLNRDRLCELLGLEFQFKTMSFPDRAAAIEWVLRNQLGRRNLSADVASRIRGMLFNLEKKRHGGDRKSRVQNEPLIGERTAERFAKEHGVSSSTIKRDGQYAAALDQLPVEVSTPILNGQTSLSRADVIELPKKSTEEQRAAVSATSSIQKPEPAQAMVDEAKWFSSTVSALGRIRREIESMAGTKFGARIDLDDCLNQIRQLQNCLKVATPHAECPECQRKVTKSCKLCRGCGFITKTDMLCLSDLHKRWLASAKPEIQTGPTDEDGTPIPEHLHDLLEARPLATAILESLIPKSKENALRIKQVWPGIDIKRIEKAQSELYAEYGRVPRYVCKSCLGEKGIRCARCEGKGWTTTK